MGEAGGADYLADGVELADPRFRGVFLPQSGGYLGCHRTAYAGYFDAVGQAIVDKYAAGKRKHLGFVLQTSERRGKDQPVKVALEVTARAGFRVVEVFEPEAFVVDESVP